MARTIPPHHHSYGKIEGQIGLFNLGIVTGLEEKLTLCRIHLLTKGLGRYMHLMLID